MRTITLDDIKQAAAALDPHADNGGKCEYTTRTGTHCMVGQILVDLGVPCPTNRSKYNVANPTTLASKFLPRHKISLTHEAAEFLDSVQSNADQGLTWGSAFNQTLQDMEDY